MSFKLRNWFAYRDNLPNRTKAKTEKSEHSTQCDTDTHTVGVRSHAETADKSHVLLLLSIYACVTTHSVNSFLLNLKRAIIWPGIEYVCLSYRMPLKCCCFSRKKEYLSNQNQFNICLWFHRVPSIVYVCKHEINIYILI